MTHTDDELTRLISTEVGGASLMVGRDLIERRGRQRRRRTRIAAAMATVAVLAGGAASGVDRRIQADQAAALNRACQAGYTTEVGKTRRAAQLPATLGSPVIELERDDARLRLYAGDPGPLRSMNFVCVRAADGTVTGRLSYGPNTAQKPETPIRAYRSYLPDGTMAIVTRLSDPAGVLSVHPAHSDIQLAQHDRLAVVWGPRAALADATLHLGGSRLDLARDSLPPTATFDEADFEQQCRRTLNDSPDLQPATLLLTSRNEDTVLKLYRAGQSVAVCHWQNLPDIPSYDGPVLSYDGPAIAVTSSTNMAVGSSLSGVGLYGQFGWMAGLTPPATERVVVIAEDGTQTEAELVEGACLAWTLGAKRKAIIITTATTIYTSTEAGMTEQPR
jgi:hypothetical protein